MSIQTKAGLRRRSRGLPSQLMTQTTTKRGPQARFRGRGWGGLQSPGADNKVPLVGALVGFISESACIFFHSWSTAFYRHRCVVKMLRIYWGVQRCPPPPQKEQPKEPNPPLLTPRELHCSAPQWIIPFFQLFWVPAFERRARTLGRPYVVEGQRPF